MIAMEGSVHSDVQSSHKHTKTQRLAVLFVNMVSKTRDEKEVRARGAPETVNEAAPHC